MTTDLRDVHTEHCCKDHGCKYGVGITTPCTVTSGEKAQSFPCEICDWLREQVATYLPEATDAELLAEVYRRGWAAFRRGT